jgi:O-antigen/teichoic acid export membrane protein
VYQQAKDNNSFNLQAFSSDVLIYSFGQAILLIFGFIQSLIIPKYLSTTDYGYWQLFLLYTTYVGILHLGFLDGILVRWAGKDIQALREEIPTTFRFILLEQGVIVSILVMVVGLIDIPSKKIALAVLANAFIVNLLIFFLFTAQATKRFKLVTATNIGRGLLFIVFILLLFFSGHLSYFSIILATMATGIIIVFLFVFHTRDCLFYHRTERKSLLQYGKENIGIGIFVLLGNFIALTFATIDRLTVGSYFPIAQFAVYTFAMSMCCLATVFLQAVAQVFFPYLSGSGTETRKKAYGLLKPSLVIFWAVILTAYFPFSFWIRYYLPHYADSLPLMAVLLCTIGFSGQINILHANFFKAYRKQKTYFILATISLIVAGALNLLAVSLLGTLKAVAATAVVSFSFWYILNEVALRNLVATPVREIMKWLLVIGAYIVAFLGTYMVAETWAIGLGIYSLLFTGITTICLYKETKQLWRIIHGIVKSKKDYYPNCRL